MGLGPRLEVRQAQGLTLIEAVVPRMDVPPLLSQIAREAGRVNRSSE